MTRWPDDPPQLGASFYKAHGLGNDYLVFEEGNDWCADPSAVTRVCDRYRGVGADGIVVLLRDESDGVFRLRMFNPDGSEFERSGNGLRILATYLLRERAVDPPYTVQVGGHRVELDVKGGRETAHDVSVQMGRACVGHEAVELEAGVLDRAGRMDGPAGEGLHVVPVSVGNPHLVVLEDEPTEARLGEVGPFLVAHPALAHGANVQLAARTAPGECRALIWERGVGPTAASGTSACAVAVALVTTGRLEPGAVVVRMPGGALSVAVSEDLDVVLRGPVEEVCSGVLTERMLDRLGRSPTS